MRLAFTKMNGAGNDFVMMDNRDGGIRLTRDDIVALCDRRRGVGADGLILIERDPEADFRMRYYNRDGGEAEMCGNGARCAAWFADRLGLGRREHGTRRVTFMTIPGPMWASVDETRVTIGMTNASAMETEVSLDLAQRREIVHVINTGVPHAIVEVPDVDAMSDGEVVERGRGIRCHARFAPEGSNVNFISLRKDGAVAIRTYERGVEAETLACGTGAVAGAIIGALRFGLESPVAVRTRGGDTLTVSFTAGPDGATDVTLAGPAAVNFHGAVQLPI